VGLRTRSHIREVVGLREELTLLTPAGAPRAKCLGERPTIERANKSEKLKGTLRRPEDATGGLRTGARQKGFG
jgi:hypothetical protein